MLFMLFSEQILQNSVNENFKYKLVNLEQTKIQIDKLNKEYELSISVEWEIIVLNSLHKVGKVEFERKIGSKFPDIHFSSEELGLEFIADITTVSDYGLQEENPTILFEILLKELIIKNGLLVDNFTCKISSAPKIPTGNSKIKLKLPEKSNFYKEILNKNLKDYLKSIKESSISSSSYEIRNENIDFVLEYNSAQKNFTVSMTAHDVYLPVRQNPFYNALKNKASKLKQCNYDGIKGIILCDGGSSMFFFRKNGFIYYGSEQTISEFLRQHSSIDFITLVFVDRETFKLKTETYINRNSHKNIQVKKLFDDLEKVLPQAQTNAHSAMYYLTELRVIGDPVILHTFDYPS